MRGLVLHPSQHLELPRQRSCTERGRPVSDRLVPLFIGISREHTRERTPEHAGRGAHTAKASGIRWSGSPGPLSGRKPSAPGTPHRHLVHTGQSSAGTRQDSRLLHFKKLKPMQGPFGQTFSCCKRRTGISNRLGARRNTTMFALQATASATDLPVC